MACINAERLYAKMRASELDAFVVVKPENFYYTTGYQNHFGGLLTGPGASRHVAAVAVIPADETLNPTMLISTWEEVPGKDTSGFEDIRTFPLWVEIFDLEDLEERRTKRVEKPFQYDMRRNVAMVGEILREKNLDAARLGIELDYISQKAFSFMTEELPGAHFVDSSPLFYDITAVKTPEELKILRDATMVTQRATLAVAQDELLGATVGEVRLKYQMAVLREAAANRLGVQQTKLTMSIGGDFAPKTGSPPYPAAMGDIIFFDPGVMLKGYQSDIGRSMVVGEPNEFQKGIISILRDGFEKMLSAIKPGVRCSDIFTIGQEKIRTSGLDSYTRGHLGHAVGVGKNERPPFIAPGDDTVIEPGMVFSVETPLYIQGAGGFQIEDTIVVTEKGYELLGDHWPRDLLQVR